MENIFLYALLGGYVAIIIVFGTWAIVRARREYRKHKKFVNSMKVGDIVMYRNLYFEILEMNNNHIGPVTSIKIKTEGYLNKEDFGFLRPISKKEKWD